MNLINTTIDIEQVKDGKIPPPKFERCVIHPESDAVFTSALDAKPGKEDLFFGHKIIFYGICDKCFGCALNRCEHLEKDLVDAVCKELRKNLN